MLMACAAFAAHAGFYRVEKPAGGAWRMAAPDGRGVFLSGVDHVKWTGQRCERTGRAAYHETNLRKYGAKAAWETNTLARLGEWGFNLLGAGCDPDLRHRGPAHTVYLDIGGKMAKKGGDCAMRPNPGDVPCGGFPNVFSPEWERMCEKVAQETCAKGRDDPDLVGYFIDNELAWWGTGAFDLASGLFDCVAALPTEHSARKALDAFLREASSGTAAAQGIKTAFLGRVAERYFSVASAAIRRADPNHLVLGCRFAGLNGAHRVVWESAGRHCDVVTFNCYPWVDLDCGEVMSGDAMRDVRFGDAVSERYGWAQKPFMVTEWSFPALDSGLPCRHGAGQRFRTQAERTRATELFLHAMMEAKPIVGHSYFMWVDEPYWGIRKELPEDSNYGLVNENDEPYPLVDVFARLSRQTNAKPANASLPESHPKTTPTQPSTPNSQPKTPNSQPPTPNSQLPTQNSQPPTLNSHQPTNLTFSRVGDVYSLWNRRGLELVGRLGGAQMFESVALCGVAIGSWNAMLHYEREGKPVWRDADKVSGVRWDAARGVLVLRSEGGAGGVRFAITHEIAMSGDSPRFLARCTKIENVGREPLAAKAVYFRQYAPYAAASVNEDRVPNLWKEPKRAAWNDPVTGRRWGGWTDAADSSVFVYYFDGSQHPDAGFCPWSRDDASGMRVLSCGAAYAPPEDCAWMVAEADAPAAEVDPFIGTAGTGHTYPGPTRPFGMVQPGPDTGYGDWQHCSGYRWEDAKILGFSQTHLNGTGCSDLGDFLLLPFIGAMQEGEPHGVKDRETETAWPGYYSVALTNFGVRAEVTAAKRVAFHRWTFPKGATAKVLLDLQYGAVERSKDVLHTHVVSSSFEFGEGGRSLSGGNVLSAWLRREAHFALAFDRRWKSYRILPPRDSREKAKRIVFAFDPPPDGVLEARIAVSAVDAAGARGNLAAEGGMTFEACRRAAAEEWNSMLARADIGGADCGSRKVFKTGLYHLFMQPNDLADADGRCRGADGKVARAADGHSYSGFSLWDTFRAAHPLYTILAPERVDGFVNSMLAQYRAVGYLPVIPYFGCETFCMIGNHSVPVVVDAYLKGFRGFDARLAFEAVTNSLTVAHRGKPKEDWGYYDRLGYYPYDMIRGEGVSRTLECAYDDSCAARFAAALGEKDAAEFFAKRSGNWRNVFDAGKSLFVRGRDIRGNWRWPFDPRRIGGGGDWMPYDCTEGNAWQYTWHVLHDPAGLAAAFGGAKSFGERLDLFFADSGRSAGAEDCPDAAGNYGQYAHGNEPSHHVAYLYGWTDRPWMAGARVREIAGRFYSAAKDGVCGNDDCGQMDAWYVFAAFGFYPVDPCGGEYALGAPLFPRAEVRLPGGKRFSVLACRPSDDSKYASAVFMDGKPVTERVVRHNNIMGGGEILFEMSDKAPSARRANGR
ncbi:MAG: GH92 family glycosyl hydrolase [Kiritimatiellae bacterium]|nr:GH92 family glycosyl hydrolase [Kiritimatiellia bacterium]